MLESGRRSIGFRHQQIPGHAQVDYDRQAIREIEEQIFPTPSEPSKSLSQDGGIELVVNERLDDSREIEELRGDDCLALNESFESDACCFDFRELRHGIPATIGRIGPRHTMPKATPSPIRMSSPEP